jgi:hypothetical protein
MKTRVITGIGNITKAIAKFQSNIKKSWCACVDSSIPVFSMSEKIKRGYMDAKKRGVRIRYITEITKDNLPYCKELVKYVELRHLSGITCSFAVSESEFVAGIRGKTTLKKLIYSNVREIIAHQQEVFDTLWKNALPALARMQEL